MGEQTKIEWADATWNPVRGCTKISPGCKHCYAEVFAERFRGVPGHPFEQGFDLKLVPSKLEDPLKWKRPRRVFVNSMSDLFHEDIPEDYIWSVAHVMMEANRHTYQILTKRADRLCRMLNGRLREAAKASHIWWGVSVEDQARADERIPLLMASEAAVRWLSLEPLLGRIDLSRWLGDGIQWVVVGGESGRNARPCDHKWIRSIVRQCMNACVPRFVKQLGSQSYYDDEIPYPLDDPKGGDPVEWPEDLRVREFPEVSQ